MKNNEHFPVISQPGEGSGTTLNSFTEQVEKILNNILKSPIYRGRPGDNFKTMTLDEYNYNYFSSTTNNAVTCKQSLYNLTRIRTFLSELDWFDNLDSIINGGAYNFGIKNVLLYIVENIDELPDAVVSEPIIFSGDDSSNSDSYILYISSNSEKTELEYKILNLTNKTNLQTGKAVSRIAYKKWTKDSSGYFHETKDKSEASIDLRGPQGEAGTGANYELGIGVSFFTRVYGENDEKKDSIWDELHRPVMYITKKSLSDGVMSLHKADEPSGKVRYIVDLKVLDTTDKCSQEAGYALCQWEDFIVDLLSLNIELDGNRISGATGSGTPTYKDLAGKEHKLEGLESNIADEISYELANFDMELWDIAVKNNPDELATDYHYPYLYKCVKYNDVLLYEENKLMDECSYFNYNSVFKTAWHAYHRVMQASGLGDKDSLKTGTTANEYRVALNACWDVTNNYYYGRNNKLMITCYDMKAKDTVPAVTLGGRQMKTDSLWNCAKLSFEDDTANSQLEIDFTTIRLTAQQVHIQTQCLNTCAGDDAPHSFKNDIGIVGYGGGHGDHLFGIDKDKLFTWMHSPGDIVVAQSTKPSWSSVKGYDSEDNLIDCWELIDIKSNTALTFGPSTSTSGFLPANQKSMKNSIMKSLPKISFLSDYWTDRGSKTWMIESKSISSQVEQNGGNIAVLPYDKALEYSRTRRKRGDWDTWVHSNGVDVSRDWKFRTWPDDFGNADTSSSDFTKITGSNFKSDSNYAWATSDSSDNLILMQIINLETISKIDYVPIRHTVEIDTETETKTYYIKEDTNLTFLNSTAQSHTVSLTVYNEDTSETGRGGPGSTTSTVSFSFEEILTAFKGILISTKDTISDVTTDNSIYIWSEAGNYQWKNGGLKITSSSATTQVSVPRITNISGVTTSNHYFYNSPLESAIYISKDVLLSNKIFGYGNVTSKNFDAYNYQSNVNQMINQYIVFGFLRTNAQVTFTCDTVTPETAPVEPDPVTPTPDPTPVEPTANELSWKVQPYYVKTYNNNTGEASITEGQVVALEHDENTFISYETIDEKIVYTIYYLQEQADGSFVKTPFRHVYNLNETKWNSDATWPNTYKTYFGSNDAMNSTIDSTTPGYGTVFSSYVSGAEKLTGLPFKDGYVKDLSGNKYKVSDCIYGGTTNSSPWKHWINWHSVKVYLNAN